jgi:hypothetical protein
MGGKRCLIRGAAGFRHGEQDKILSRKNKQFR